MPTTGCIHAPHKTPQQIKCVAPNSAHLRTLWILPRDQRSIDAHLGAPFGAALVPSTLLPHRGVLRVCEPSHRPPLHQQRPVRLSALRQPDRVVAHGRDHFPRGVEDFNGALQGGAGVEVNTRPVSTTKKEGIDTHGELDRAEPGRVAEPANGFSIMLGAIHRDSVSAHKNTWRAR